MTTFPAVTVKSDLGKETLYMSPVMSPSLPKALTMPDIQLPNIGLGKHFGACHQHKTQQ
jgi:hypothetical protein